MNRSWMKPLAIAAFALSLATPLGALAATGDATSVTVTGGTLTSTTPLANDFPGVTIDGASHSPTAALATFSVSDLTGTGAGWHVTAGATQFTGASHSLAVGSLELSQPTVAANGTTSADPTINIGPYTIDNGAVTIASAAVGAGMGNYDFSATTLTLAIPADVYADTYTSTVTITVVTGP